MTLDEWLTAYVLRFGVPSMLKAWQAGEEEFCEQAALSLGIDVERAAVGEVALSRVVKFFREEYYRVYAGADEQKRSTLGAQGT